MAHQQNLQFALPSKPGGGSGRSGGKRRKKKSVDDVPDIPASPPLTSSAKRAMFEHQKSGASMPGNKKKSDQIPSLPQADDISVRQQAYQAAAKQVGSLTDLQEFVPNDDEPVDEEIEPIQIPPQQMAASIPRGIAHSQQHSQPHVRAPSRPQVPPASSSGSVSEQHQKSASVNAINVNSGNVFSSQGAYQRNNNMPQQSQNHNRVQSHGPVMNQSSNSNSNYNPHRNMQQQQHVQWQHRPNNNGNPFMQQNPNNNNNGPPRNHNQRAMQHVQQNPNQHSYGHGRGQSQGHNSNNPMQRGNGPRLNNNNHSGGRGGGGGGQRGGSNHNRGQFSQGKNYRPNQNYNPQQNQQRGGGGQAPPNKRYSANAVMHQTNFNPNQPQNRGGSRNNIMINDESVRGINKSGTVVPKEKTSKKSPKSTTKSVTAPSSIATSPTSPSSPSSSSTTFQKQETVRSPKSRQSIKAEQKEIDDFVEKVSDIRWIPHSKDGFVIAQFKKRDGKFSIYQPFDDNDLFQIPGDEESNKPKQKRKAIKIPTLKVKSHGMKIENWECMDQNVADMVELPDLSSPYVLHNLKHRFLARQIYVCLYMFYGCVFGAFFVHEIAFCLILALTQTCTYMYIKQTRVGEIIISINPYELLPLYLPSVLEAYRYKRDQNDLDPHIYDVARTCYSNIISTSRAQGIIISGESGSGKTECTKQILQFIAECAGNDNQIEQKLLSTNPILESFGNCRTVRNNNSSRFGKYIEIYFNSGQQIIKSNNNQIIKSFQTIYALEKVRVCKKSKEERNYHIFYQLMFCNDQQLKKRLKLGKVSNYAYLQGVETAPGINDADDFIHLNKAFKDIGCFANDEDKNTVFNIYKLCSAILWIGNILFEQDAQIASQAQDSIDKQGGSCKIASKSETAVKLVCQLLEIENPDDLRQALMFKSVQFGGDSKNGGLAQIALSKMKAFESRDALAKFLYKELFSWIVDKLNEYLVDNTLIKHDNDRLVINLGGDDDGKQRRGPEFNPTHHSHSHSKSRSMQIEQQGLNMMNPNYRVLGVLDIFGFEILEKNSFEQLCVNYTNERLQYQFDQTVFRNEETLYQREGIIYGAR